MNNINQCFCCNSKKIKKLIEVNNFPYLTAPLSTKDKINIINSNKLKKYFDNLSVKYCIECTHIFLSQLPNLKIINELYSKYYTYPSAILGSFIPSRDINFIKFLKKFLQKKDQFKSFFEIGCYDGYILHQLKLIGYNNVSGCDPSSGADIGNKFGVKIYKKFFSLTTNFAKKKYDFIIARHLVEHLEKPKLFFNQLNKITHQNSKVILEVPNGEFYTKNGLIEVFSHQHIHLFSKYSMHMLVKKTKFFIEKVIDSEANLYFVLSKKKKIKSFKKIQKIDSFLKKYNEKIYQISNYIKKFANNKIIFYGAGGFCCAAIHLYKIKKKNIFSIIDSDKTKINKEFLDINIKIDSVDNLKKYKNKLIIITSYYTKDIIKIIKNNLNTNILAIHPEVKLHKKKLL